MISSTEMPSKTLYTLWKMSVFGKCANKTFNTIDSKSVLNGSGSHSRDNIECSSSQVMLMALSQPRELLAGLGP